MKIIVAFIGAVVFILGWLHITPIEEETEAHSLNNRVHMKEETMKEEAIKDNLRLQLEVCGISKKFIDQMETVEEMGRALDAAIHGDVLARDLQDKKG